MTTTEIERKLTELFTPCGLHADWCVRTWHVMGKLPNLGLGVYLLDQEDGNWAMVWRRAADDHFCEDWRATLWTCSEARLDILMGMDCLREHLRGIARAAIVASFTPPTA